MKIMYNDNALYPCEILDRHIAEGTLPEGDIYYGDIESIDISTFKNYTGWHLFAGIGGIPYGLRLGGWLDEWPILTAGFPCQPVSNVGKKLAQADPRWLWPEVVRVLRVVRPPVVLLENTPGLLSRGMGDVLRDLAQSGYDAKWRVLSAADVGAPHLRERVWIVAYPDGLGPQGGRLSRILWERFSKTVGRSGSMENAQSQRLAYPENQRNVRRNRCLPEDVKTTAVGDYHRDRAQANDGREWWAAEPDVGRVAHGLPHRVDRLKSLGNAVVPQAVAELVPWILESEEESK